MVPIPGEDPGSIPVEETVYDSATTTIGWYVSFVAVCGGGLSYYSRSEDGCLA